MSDTLRLFLIEDDDDIALLVRKHLERAGHQVTCCRTATADSDPHPFCRPSRRSPPAEKEDTSCAHHWTRHRPR